jgi:lipoprotein LenA
MKKIVTIIIITLLTAGIGCKKEKPEVEEEMPLAKKYATVRIAVYKDKQFKNWLATLEKAEGVDLLAEEGKIPVEGKKEPVEVAKIKLADDAIGYTRARFLADKPIVFVEEEVKLHIRPTATSKVYSEVPRGTIGFITGEKANWVQVFIGRLKGKWIEEKWAESGYSSDTDLIVDATMYEKAMALLDEKNKKKAKDEAMDILEDLAKSTTLFAELARTKIQDLSNETPDMIEPEEDVELTEEEKEQMAQ